MNLSDTLPDTFSVSTSMSKSNKNKLIVPFTTLTLQRGVAIDVLMLVFHPLTKC